MGTTETAENHSFLLMASKKKRMSLSTSRLSFSSVGQKFPVIFPTGSRLFKILYQLSIKVKTGGEFYLRSLWAHKKATIIGVEVMEINVPIIIGSVPYELVLARTLSQMTEKEKAKINTPLLPEEKVVNYRQNKKDRPVQLAIDGEHYICNRAQVKNNFRNYGSVNTFNNFNLRAIKLPTKKFKVFKWKIQKLFSPEVLKY